MRQTNAGPSCSVPVVCHPPWLSKSSPVVGVEPHARRIGPPQAEKSTAKMTPDVVVQSAIGKDVALEGVGAPNASALATIVRHARRTALAADHAPLVLNDLPCSMAREGPTPDLWRQPPAPQPTTAQRTVARAGGPTRPLARTHGCGSAPESHRLPRTGGVAVPSDHTPRQGSKTSPVPARETSEATGRRGRRCTRAAGRRGPRAGRTPRSCERGPRAR
jgi:hypothetical protein